MGYYTRYEGEISISPPLNWSQIKNSPFLPGTNQPSYEVKFRVQTEIADTPEGTLTKRYADAVVPYSEDRYKGYDVLQAVQKIIDSYPEHEFEGRFNCEGEDAGDVWRLVVRGRTAVKVEPRVIWPDEESSDG